MEDIATPKRSERKRVGRPVTYAIRSEPQRKKLRYTPVGTGGRGRSDKKEAEAVAQSTGRRPRRQRVDDSPPTTTRSPAPIVSRPRREKATVQPRYTSASAAATAMTQNEGYKPREERGWEEFHPDLDIDAELVVFRAEEVDGYTPGSTTPMNGVTTPLRTFSDGVAMTGMINTASPLVATLSLTGIAPPATAPFRRRVGRPPKSQSMLSGLGSPPAPRITPLPTHNPKERLNLPKPNYRRIETFASYEQDKSISSANYVDKSMSSLGYQESDRFSRPDRIYIRGGEGSIEEELDIEMGRQMLREGTHNANVIGRVEYDMDEQDERWLDGVNAERKSEGVDAIKPAIFEIVMTIIEKEWHALEKRIPKPSPKQPQTQRPRAGSAAAVNGEPADTGEEPDSKCAICDDGDCENANAIVFCDGCDLAVHQECYGVPFIPEGQWLCRKCQLIGRSIPTCVFCPNIDGAFKQTNTLRWAHLLCSLNIPEVTVANTTFMEPITDVEKVPKQRWKLTCYICKQHMGACVQCSNKACFQAFHVTCARRARLFLKMKNPVGSITDHAHYKQFCHKHSPADFRKEHDTDRAYRDAVRFYQKTMKNRVWADSQTAALAVPVQGRIEAADGDGDINDPLSAAGNNKRKKAALQKKIWRLPGGAPIVPETVFSSVENLMSRFALRKRKEFVAEACKYWSLKREARRGAPLIKRFQASMESFTSMEMTRRNFAAMGSAGRSRLDRRIQFAELLEGDMDQLIHMCRQVKDREVLKIKDGEILRQLVDSLYFPVVPILQPIFEKIQGYDLNGKLYFKKGLDLIEEKMSNRGIVSIIDFAILLGKAFSEAIASEESGDGTAIDDENATRAKALVVLQKDKKARAKRIIGLVKPLLQEAVRKESDLGKKDFETEWHEIETILSDSTTVQTHSFGAPSVTHTDEGDEERLQSPRKKAAVPTHSVDVKMPDLDLDHKDSKMEMEATDLLDGLPEHLTNGQTQQRANSNSSVNGNAPALSHSGSTVPSINPEPLTPPTLNIVKPSTEKDDLLAPLREGGVAWYLSEFEPEGTTIHDPDGWDGRNLIRDMSEELSELDDDAIDGLMMEEESKLVGVDIEMTDAPSVAVDQKLNVAAATNRRSVRRRVR